MRVMLEEGRKGEQGGKEEGIQELSPELKTMRLFSVLCFSRLSLQYVYFPFFLMFISLLPPSSLSLLSNILNMTSFSVFKGRQMSSETIKIEKYWNSELGKIGVVNYYQKWKKEIL